MRENDIMRERQEKAALLGYFLVPGALTAINIAGCRLSYDFLRLFTMNFSSRDQSTCDKSGAISGSISLVGLSLVFLIYHAFFSAARESLAETIKEDSKRLALTNLGLGPVMMFLTLYLWFQKNLSDAGIFGACTLFGTFLLTACFALIYKLGKCTFPSTLESERSSDYAMSEPPRRILVRPAPLDETIVMKQDDSQTFLPVTRKDSLNSPQPAQASSTFQVPITSPPITPQH